MHEIQADMRLSEQDDVYAYGQVMIDRCIKFPVQMRRYIDNESGEEKAFLSYPRKEYKGEWKDVVSTRSGAARQDQPSSWGSN